MRLDAQPDPSDVDTICEEFKNALVGNLTSACDSSGENAYDIYSLIFSSVVVDAAPSNPPRPSSPVLRAAHLPPSPKDPNPVTSADPATVTVTSSASVSSDPSPSNTSATRGGCKSPIPATRTSWTEGLLN